MLKVLYVGETPYRVMGEMVKPTLAQAWGIPEDNLITIQISDDIPNMKRLIGKGAMNGEQSKANGKYSAEGTMIVLERTSNQNVISLVHKFASNAGIELRDDYEPASLEDMEDDAIIEWARTGRVPAEADGEMDFDAMFEGDDMDDLFGDDNQQSSEQVFTPPMEDADSDDFSPASMNFERVAPTNHNAPPMPGDDPVETTNAPANPEPRPMDPPRRESREPAPQGDPDVNNIPGFQDAMQESSPDQDQLPARPPEPPQVSPTPEPPRRGRHSADAEETQFPVPPELLEQETMRQRAQNQGSGHPSFHMEQPSSTEQEFKSDIFGEDDEQEFQDPTPTQSFDVSQLNSGDAQPNPLPTQWNPQQYGGQPYPGQPQGDQPYGSQNPWGQQYPGQYPGPQYPGQNPWSQPYPPQGPGPYGSAPPQGHHPEGYWGSPPPGQPQYPGQNPQQPGAGWPGNGPQPRGAIVPFMERLPERDRYRQGHMAEIQRVSGSIRHNEHRHNQGVCLYMTGSNGGVGKTTFSWTCANVIAKLRQSNGGEGRVWLVEADYKNPKLEMQLRHMGMGKNSGNLIEVFRNINPATSPQRTMDFIEANSVTIDGSGLKVLPAPFNYSEYDGDQSGYSREAIAWVLQRTVQFLIGMGETVFIDADNITAQTYEPLDQVLAGRLATHCVVVTVPGKVDLGMRSVQTLLNQDFGKSSNNVHVFLNRSDKQQLNEAVQYFNGARVGTVGAFPLITELLDEWVGDATPEINSALVARAGLALGELGFREARDTFNQQEVDLERKPGFIRRFLGRMGL